MIIKLYAEKVKPERVWNEEIVKVNLCERNSGRMDVCVWLACFLVL